MLSINFQVATGSASPLLRIPAELRVRILEEVLEEAFILRLASRITDHAYTKYYILWNTGVTIVNRQIRRESCSILLQNRYFRHFHDAITLRQSDPYSTINHPNHSPTREQWLKDFFGWGLSRFFSGLLANWSTLIRHPRILNEIDRSVDELNSIDKYIIGEVQVHDRKVSTTEVEIYPQMREKTFEQLIFDGPNVEQMRLLREKDELDYWDPIEIEDYVGLERLDDSEEIEALGLLEVFDKIGCLETLTSTRARWELCDHFNAITSQTRRWESYHST